MSTEPQVTNGEAETTQQLIRKLQLCQQIARLVRARLPIVGQLGKLAEQYPDVPADLAREASHKLEAGFSLSDALADGSSLNSRSLAGCILSGERAQCLDTNLDAWAEMQLNNIRSRRNIFINLLYPIVLVGTALVAIFLLVERIVPMYAAIYEQWDHQLPDWLLPVLWFHENLWALLVALFVFFLLPVGIYVARQRGLNRHGLPNSLLHRHRLYALSSEVAQRMLDAGIPLEQTVKLSCQAAGKSSEQAQQEVSRLEANDTIHSLAPEASLLLNSVHTGLISAKEAAKDLQQTSKLYYESAQEGALARARRIPVMIACSVGLAIVSVYAGLIYGPWVQLLLDLTQVSGQ